MMDHQACNQDFEKGGGGGKGGLNRESIFFVLKLSELDGVAEQTCATQPQVYHRQGSGVEVPRLWAIFVIFRNYIHFNVIWITICTFLEPF